jgi:hypothetical protein
MSDPRRRRFTLSVAGRPPQNVLLTDPWYPRRPEVLGALHLQAQRRPLRISLHPDPPFRSKSITHFARSRSPVSEQVDHPFRSKPITRFG